MANTAADVVRMVNEATVNELLPDMPPGPLSEARSKASFCWRKMRIFMEEEGLLRFKMRVWRAMESDPLFAHSAQTLPLEEERRVNSARLKKLRELKLLPLVDEFVGDMREHIVFLEALNSYDPNLMLRYTVLFQFFSSAIRGLGTDKHAHILEKAEAEEISGCFCMTEIAHGSNTKALRTTATYIPEDDQFELHTPDFEAAKCWAGALGHTATHAVVFAQLLTPDGRSHGLHCFYVQIRDPNTLHALPGITIGDMGEKLGLNAIDNGFMVFHNYRVPKASLLDRTGSVGRDGRYVTPYKDSKKRFGASLTSLLSGRMAITGFCSSNLSKSMVIAVRYSAVRRQFAPAGQEQELPVLAYQSHQWHLMPLLSAAYAISAFSRHIIKEYMEFYMGLFTGGDRDKLDAIGIEMHALLSSAKPLSSWTAQQAIQECREACGGHGYLRVAGFGALRNDNDANCTYEGANEVILQQSSNWLLGLWAERSQKSPGCTSVNFESPLGSVRFLHNIERASAARFRATSAADLARPELILEAYQWLICHLIEATEAEHRAQLKAGKDPFMARNDSQVYFARTLSLAYIEHYCLLCFWEKASAADVDPSLKPILTKLAALFGVWRLETHLASLYQGGFANGPLPARLIRQAILQLSYEIAQDAVPLADALAPPDFILNSALGVADGEVYKALQAAFYQNAGTFERPHWWREALPNKPTTSKL